MIQDLYEIVHLTVLQRQYNLTSSCRRNARRKRGPFCFCFPKPSPCSHTYRYRILVFSESFAGIIEATFCRDMNNNIIHQYTTRWEHLIKVSYVKIAYNRSRNWSLHTSDIGPLAACELCWQKNHLREFCVHVLN